MKVTVCEMPDDPGEFSEAWVKLAKHVKSEGSELLLLPEMPFFYWFCAGPKFDPAVWREATAKHRGWMKRLPELGEKAVLGTSPVERGTGRRNEGFVWTGEGTRWVHQKRYVPNMAGWYEGTWYQRGTKPFAPFEVEGWKAGFMVCSDIWSMANARQYGKKGVDLIAVPRATGTGSVDKWVAGGRVAAVVAGAYCLSSNRVGKRGDAEFGGKGWVVDPDGGVLGLTSKGRPFVTVEIDRTKAQKAKNTYPRDSLEPD